MAFYIGDTVVCIDDSIPLERKEYVQRTYNNWVVKDEEYKVRDILENDGIVQGILLEGVYNTPVFIPLINIYQEPAFAEWRFRKIKNQEVLVEQEVEVLEMV
jgi:hypothetical protein